MTDTIEFGKRVNRRPLTISFILSFLAGGLGFLSNIKVSIIAFLIVLFLLLGIYYPLNVPALFGHWQLEKHGISYYKMNNYRDKLRMVCEPDKTDFQFISYSQIKGFQVVERDHKYNLTDLLTINPAKQSYLPWLRKPFYLELQLHHGVIKLDLSWDQLHDKNNTLYRLSNALQIINQKI